MGLCPKPRPPAFLSEKSGAKELNFLCFTLSFRAGIYGTKTGTVSRRINFVIFACLSAKIAGGLTAFVWLNLCHTNGHGFAKD